MTTENTIDLAQCAAGLADAAALMAEAAEHLSEAARTMYHVSQPEVNIFLDNKNTGESGDAHALSSHRSDTEDVNVHRPESRVGTPASLSSTSERTALHPENTPSPPLSPKALVFTRDELHDTLLFPGRYYVILEEEFDILPLIAAYASISHKTLCCMPFVEASQSWRVLLSAISPNHEVIEVAAQPSPFSPGVAQYMSSDKPSLLIQSFATWQTYQTVTSISDAFLAWGFLNVEDNQLTRIRDTILSAHHTCAIVTQQEFENSKFKAYFASLGLVEHPNSSLIKQFDTTGLLTSSRAITRLILHDSDFYHNVHLLYKAALDFYTTTPIGEARWSKTRTAELANNFAAKILLHGREEDGSARFKPNGAMLPVDQKTIQKLGLSLPAQLGLIEEGMIIELYGHHTGLVLNIDAHVEDESSEDNGGSSYESDNAPGACETNRALSPGPAPNMNHANHPNHTYIIPEEDFDILPLIAYFAGTHSKTVCYISQCENATPFQAILGKLISRKISRPGKNSKNTEDQISKFLRSGPGLLLLRGSVPPPVRLTNAAIDAVICYVNTQINLPRAKHTFLILSKAEKALLTNAFVSKHKLKPHPESARFVAHGSSSPLLPYRERTRAALSQSTKSLKTAYLDKLLLSSTSKSESARRANEFMAKVFLHGSPQDGSKLYPPVSPRLRLTRKEVSKRGLEQAVEQGLVLVNGA